jgi:hypothetical protein
MWNRKKKSKSRVPTNTGLIFTPQEYPAGTCVETTEGFFFINKDHKRYRIVSDRIFDSWKFPLVVYTSEQALAKYPVALTKLGFRDGTLLNNLADGKLYLVSGSVLRHITGPDIMARLGITKDDAISVSDAEIKIMKTGEDLY